jgi:DNA-binding transcriptional regulator YiaG
MDISQKLYDAGDVAALEASQDKANVSKDIQLIMEKMVYSQRQLAEFYGISEFALRQWRKGKCPSDYFILRQLHYTAQKLSQ